MEPLISLNKALALVFISIPGALLLPLMGYFVKIKAGSIVHEWKGVYDYESLAYKFYIAAGLYFVIGAMSLYQVHLHV